MPSHVETNDTAAVNIFETLGDVITKVCEHASPSEVRKEINYAIM